MPIPALALALAPMIIEALPSAMDFGKFIANLFEQRKRLQEENRPDVNDERIAFLDAMIDAVQARINKNAES